jgi:uncharacterized protein (DUF4415 family)
MKTYKRALTLEEIAQMVDDNIDYSDIPPADNEFWEKAVLIPPPGKERLTLRLDNYVIDYFKRRGRGYQSRINAVLRSYVEAQVRAEAEEKGQRAALVAAAEKAQAEKGESK